jgi:hypothetical protein
MLELNEQIAKQGKYANNFENNGDDKVSYVSIPYTEVFLGEDQIDGLMGKLTYKSWFNINGTDITPMDWTRQTELSCETKFKEVSVTMFVNRDKQLEFDECRLYIDSLKPLPGGQVEAAIHIHVIDPSEKDLIQIVRAQFTEVKLSLGDGVVIERKTRGQRELPLEGGEDVGGDSEESASTTTPLNGSHLMPDHMHVWWQNAAGEQFNGKRSEMPQGCVEIDPPTGSKSEREQLAAKDEAGTADDSQAFEKGLADAVGAHRKRGSNVIDGRSERVKERDRKRDSAH